MNNNNTHGLPFPEADQAYPPDLAKHVLTKFSYHKAHSKDRMTHDFSLAQLTSLLNIAFQASLRTEEGRSLSFQLRFRKTPFQSDKPVQVQSHTLPFETTRELSVKELVKLAPAVGLGFRSIMIEADDSQPDAKLWITGIHDFELATSQSISSQPWALEYNGYRGDFDLLVTVFGPGSMRVTTPGNGRSCDLHEGTIHFPFTLASVGPVAGWYQEVGKSFNNKGSEDNLKNHLRNSVYTEIMNRTWARLLKDVCNRRHGGCFLVVPTDFPYEQEHTLVEAKYPLNTKILFDVLNGRAALEPELSQHKSGEDDIPNGYLDAAHFRQRDVARVANMVAGFSAVDGVVLLRRDLTIIGFGSRIGQVSSDTEAEGQEIEFKPNSYLYTPEHGKDMRRVNSFGMRHRSAIRFCHQVKGAIAFVASQDGELRVFCNDMDEVTAYEPFPSYRYYSPVD